MDTEFRTYLATKAETLKTQLTDPDLPVEAILTKAQEILKLENRIKRMDNPIPRKKRATTE
jgi:hypothetical protein